VKIIDYASGSHTERASYKELIDSVLKRQVDVVLVFHYDRLARSTIELITRVDEFHVSVSIFLLSISATIWSKISCETGSPASQT
jgi:predicted site-specific integrase-resolvase